MKTSGGSEGSQRKKKKKENKRKEGKGKKVKNGDNKGLFIKAYKIKCCFMRLTMKKVCNEQSIVSII